MQLANFLTTNQELPMLRFRLRELLADKSFREARVITLIEVAETTGIHRLTLSKIANRRGAVVRSDALDALCAYFGCRIEDLVEYVDERAVPRSPTPAKKTGQNRAGKK